MRTPPRRRFWHCEQTKRRAYVRPSDGPRLPLCYNDGAGKEIRTPDLLITSELLYRLSYPGGAAQCRSAGGPGLRGVRGREVQEEALEEQRLVRVELERLPRRSGTRRAPPRPTPGRRARGARSRLRRGAPSPASASRYTDSSAVMPSASARAPRGAVLALVPLREPASRGPCATDRDSRRPRARPRAPRPLRPGAASRSATASFERLRERLRALRSRTAARPSRRRRRVHERVADARSAPASARARPSWPPARLPRARRGSGGTPSRSSALAQRRLGQRSEVDALAARADRVEQLVGRAVTRTITVRGRRLLERLQQLVRRLRPRRTPSRSASNRTITLRSPSIGLRDASAMIRSRTSSLTR